jgi:RNA polymerase sigma-70 factor (ECF subfamily)
MDPEGSASAAAGVESLENGATPSEEVLVRRFSEAVFLMAYVRIRDRESARDLAQETMLVVIRNLRSGRLMNADKLPNYVSGTARNLINNFLRTRRRRPESGPPSDELSVPDCEPEVERSERQFLARRALAQLRPDDRLILLLTLVEGLTPAEIAERLGLSSEVVRKRKSRAVARARSVLAGVSRR